MNTRLPSLILTNNNFVSEYSILVCLFDKRDIHKDLKGMVKTFLRGILLTVIVIVAIRIVFTGLSLVMAPASYKLNSTIIPPVRIIRGKELQGNTNDIQEPLVVDIENSTSQDGNQQHHSSSSAVGKLAILFAFLACGSVIFAHLLFVNRSIRLNFPVRPSSLALSLDYPKILELELSTNEQLARLLKMSEL